LKLPAKLQLLRQGKTEKEETTSGEYNVDIVRHFKLLLPDVHETIFEEDKEERVYSSNELILTTKCVPVAILSDAMT
jgi:hypothetical protein